MLRDCTHRHVGPLLICVVLYRPTDRGTVSASGGGNGLDSDGNTSDEEEYGVDLS